MTLRELVERLPECLDHELVVSSTDGTLVYMGVDTE